ncbi:MAG TPA: alpha/beta hydrolase [Candidatus Angelobacter sp.]|nr:alpha/beta hydrolase [Candidatus Angelobacter sp.]
MVANPGPESGAFWAEIDGQRMHYQRAGSGPPLLLIHGLLGGSFCWRFNINKLAAKRTVFAPDLPGMGLSDASGSTDCSMRRQADRLANFIARNDLRDLDIVASSWGGAVALLLAARLRQIRSLVLAAPVNPWSEYGRGRIRFFSGVIGALVVRCGLPFSRRVHSLGVQRMYGDPVRMSPGTLEGYSNLLFRPGRAGNLINIMRNWEADLEFLREAIPRVNAPTLLVWGSLDGAVDPGSAQILGRSLASCRVEVLPGVGHLPFEESPEVFNRLVLDFIEHPETTCDKLSP